MNLALEYIASHRQTFESELAEVLRIPSVSSDSRQRGEVRRAAEWMLAQFQGLGHAVELVETAGHPLV